MNFKKIFIPIIIFVVIISLLLINSNVNGKSSDLSLVSDVKYISQEIGPRPAGSENENKTAHYLKSKLNSYGVKTEVQSFKYYSMYSKGVKSSENVIGIIKGASSKQIIICADLDTIKDKNTGNYTEGANDDVTSIAVLIGLAKEYQHEKPYFTIKLIGFGAGEDPYTLPVNASPRTSLNSEEYNKIMYIPYLIGARHYLLENQDSINNTVAVISLEAVGEGIPCFVSQDSFAENNQSFVNFLVFNARINDFNAEKIDFMTYEEPQGRNDPISHIYLPFSYANIPSTFLTCLENPNVNSSTHNNNEMPGYLTVNDNYENLVKNNGGEGELEKHLDTILSLVKTSINNIDKFYAVKNISVT
ncbi:MULTISPECIES: M28 family metallopeptidase [Methanobacterium]|uniref:M28 family peptidase n=1 Tax=Methanobacterium veterum TaxID=408577 RepID=A0A9E5DL56_9EURY|nr:MULTISPECIES: M28 family peptidase [Methanobacterium]MCZ3365507.1 M28 family peptidase [Methanobacterium veterum]MCZ3373259.1 M28 family peptidase [Methanobacterium veterum]